MIVFRDRADAGRQLAVVVGGLGLHDPVVLGLPRGGVPVAAEVAAALGAPLDVFVARKIGLPGHEEFGVGAVAEGMDEPVGGDWAGRAGVGPDEMSRLAARARREVAAAVARYRGGRPLPALQGLDVVLVDDGLATGVTARAALAALRRRGPARLVLAVPVGAEPTVRELAVVADDVVCVAQPPDFHAVGLAYEDFAPTGDDEVAAALARVGRPAGDD